MRLIRDVTDFKGDGLSLAIGNFDGMHIGHQAVLNDMLSQAEALGVPSAVMTFEPHPRRYFATEEAPFMLEQLHVKARRFDKHGIDYHFALRFNKDLAALHADDFIKRILVNTLSAKHITTGDNFYFGHKRSGNSDTLGAHALKHNFTYHAMNAVRVAVPERVMTCSSSRIREFLRNGDTTSATAMLGRPYEIVGRVRKGDQRGRTIGFPTANILPSRHAFAPAFGVYAVRFAVVDELSYVNDEIWHDGVANFGLRPTFGGESPRLEVHGFDFNQDVYGQRLRVQLLHHIRGEQKFDGVDALKTQIALDAQEAKQWLNQN